MPLASGTKVGPYDIVEPLGIGGMGEVYRGRDTRLGRDVALKVLPEVFAHDTQRMTRFEREAKVLASLNHPNIASTYGLEESNGTRALVMELVEGPTLAERINREEIPLEEALPIAKQICEGLEYAHERGIIHRDLKPSNIKLTPDSHVKILDFGLAKALADDAASADISSSPTISRLATQAGIILGTAAYMSPEQAKGKAVDRRADIWAFGCVLYEMLVGKPAFGGETVTDVLAAVVRADPEWLLLPNSVPTRIRELLRRSLQKDPKQRLRDIGEARIVIEEALSGVPDVDETSGQAQILRLKPWHRVLPWALFAAAMLGVVVTMAGYIARSPRPAPLIVSQIAPPDNANFVIAGNSAGPPMLSPDGKQLTFVAGGADGNARLWVRALAAMAARPLEGTEGASFPFWSPDSRSIGFFANGKLKRIDAMGSPALALADAPQARGGSWGPDGTILYTPSTIDPIYRVAASGGVPQKVTKLDFTRLETSHRWPQFLPDGKHFLFFAHTNVDQNNATYVASLQGGAPELLIHGDSSGIYAAPGYLLFIREGTLMAQRFDADAVHLIGDAVPVIEHAASDPIIWRETLSASEHGMLVYRSQSRFGENLRLLWFDRTGKQVGETGTAGNYGTLSLSPDGSKLAIARVAPGASNLDIWLYDLARGMPTRLTFSSEGAGQPCWSPDGRTIAFVSNPGQGHLSQKPADGTGTESPLVVDDGQESRPSFSSDGRYLIFERQTAQTGSHAEIWSLPLFGDRKPFPVAQSQQFDLHQPALSPNGKWLAYISPESGQYEVYVVPFIHGSGKWLVSSAGGHFPRWRHDGKELFYLSLDNKIMSAEIADKGASVVVGRLTPLFQANPTPTNGWVYDVTADGKKFIIDTLGGLEGSQPLTLVVNWPELLKK